MKIYEARVKDDDDRLIRSCRHMHRTYRKAMECAEKLARRSGWKPSRLFKVTTTSFGTLLREAESIRDARKWAEKSFPGKVKSVEHWNGKE